MVGTLRFTHAVFLSRALNSRSATNFRNRAGSSNSSVTGNGTICCDQSLKRARSFSVVTSVNPSRLASAIRLSISACEYGMMIGEGALSGHFDAAGAQRVEESRGIADAGKRQHALAPELCDPRLVRLQMR